MKIGITGGGQPPFKEVLASKLEVSQSANISLAPPNMEQLSGTILEKPQEEPQKPVRRPFRHQGIRGYQDSRRAPEPALRAAKRRRH